MRSNSYITLRDGTDFRSMAKILSRLGYPMNHATARNILISALKMLMLNVGAQLGVNMTEEKIEELLKNQYLHDSLTDIFTKISGQANELGLKT